MPELDNYRRELFCRYWLAEHGNRTKAAIRAGFEPRSAYNTGYRLMKEDEIKQRIEELKNADYDVREITPDLIKKGFLREALTADHPRDRKAAWDSLARCEAMFTENVNQGTTKDMKLILEQLRGVLSEEQRSKLARQFGVHLDQGAPEPTHEASGSVN